MKVLITGGTGTISSGLVRESVSCGYTTYTLTRGNNKSRNIDGAISLYADVFNIQMVETTIKDMTFDVVVECLAYTVKQLEISLNSFANRTKQYIFVSTAGIYNRKSGRIKEDDEKNFTDWIYTRDKIACEIYLRDYCKNNNIVYTIIRPTVTYGDYRIPFPIATRTPGWTLFNRIIVGAPIVACENVKYSVIHIEDFSKAVVKLFGNENSFNNDFNISSNTNEIYWDDVIKIIGIILEIKPKVVHVPIEVFRLIWPEIYDELKYNKNLETVLDDEKIKKVTNYDANIKLYEGMEKTYVAMKKEFEEYNLDVDRLWDAKCDNVLLYASKNNMLCLEEKEIVDDYIKNNKCAINRNRLFILRKSLYRDLCELIKNISLIIRDLK